MVALPLKSPLQVLAYVLNSEHGVVNPCTNLGRWAMPKGSVPKREAKKPKKKATKSAAIMPLPDFTSAQVEVVKKRRKPREDKDEE